MGKKFNKDKKIYKYTQYKNTPLKVIYILYTSLRNILYRKKIDDKFIYVGIHGEKPNFKFQYNWLKSTSICTNYNSKYIQTQRIKHPDNNDKNTRRQDNIWIYLLLIITYLFDKICIWLISEYSSMIKNSSHQQAETHILFNYVCKCACVYKRKNTFTYSRFIISLT